LIYSHACLLLLFYLCYNIITKVLISQKFFSMLTRQKYTKILKIAVCLFIATTAIFLLGNFTLAASAPDVGLNYAEGTGLSNTQDIRVTIANIIRIILGFLGIIAVGLIMYAGWLWMTSEGNEEKIEQAKKILQNAIIGLIIILSAFAIVSFVLNVLGGGSGGSGNNNPSGSPIKTYGLSALGNGIIQSHYPAPNQKEVPRNASIIITFREEIKASTACVTTEANCDDKNINTDVVRIFKKDEASKCTVGDTAPADCSSLIKEAKVYSDGKNYVFVPANNLGSPSEYIDYMVYLSNGLKRKSGEDAFPGEHEYHWIFEVSNKIDLTPPQVIKNSIVPAPDNARDTVTPGVGARAISTIKVLKIPSIYQDARVQNIDTATPATVEARSIINESCEQDGNFSIAIATGPIATLYKVTTQGTINLGQGTFGSSTNGNKKIVFSECNLTLTLADAADNFAVGYKWNLKLNKMIEADAIAIGNTIYTASNTESGNNFMVNNTDMPATAISIAAVINSNNLDVTASPSGNVITVTAKIAGLIGNSINLSSSNTGVLAINPMAGGTDKEDKITVKGEKDQPMNSAIEIVFNEATMPLAVSGKADDLKNYIRVVNANPAAKPTVANPADLACTADADCKSFICGSSGLCEGDNNYLKGKFEVSNQYRTVDFLSDKECGFNACGEQIYCLPANSDLRVELNAASLISCSGDGGTVDNAKCQAYSPFNICKDRTDGNFCRDNVNINSYFPQAKKGGLSIVDGIVDAAFNSLDGNRNGLAFGPVTFYNENEPGPNTGDNYQWSFFISGLMDLTPPRIKAPTAPGKEDNVELTKEIKISFSKLMLSSRLTTGSLIIKNGEENIQHYLLNVRSFTDQPLGYWATNEGVQSVLGTSAIDQTDVYINHTPFSKASTYKAQAGSGLKDIYQNCYLPCDGPACTGANTVTSEEPCCCNGASGTSCP